MNADEDIAQQKILLREQLLKMRKELSAERRAIAAQQAYEHLTQLLPKSGIVLSYASFGSELDTSAINKYFIKSSRLALPTVVGDNIKPYLVKSLKKDLKRSSLGVLEPMPEVCTEVDLAHIVAIIVPAVGFDPWDRRIGYGKGYYDRFLRQLSLPIPLYGIGFREQLLPAALPVEAHDRYLTEVFLF